MAIRLGLLSALYALTATVVAAECPPNGLGVVPVAADAVRGAVSYLVYHNGQARVAVDVGAGSAPILSRQPALNVLLLTTLRVEQTADLSTLVASFRQSRHAPLTVYGPPGSRTMPSTTTFVRTLFDGTRGAYRYLGDVVSPLSKEHFRLNVHDVTPPRLRPGVREIDAAPVLWQEDGLAVRAAPTGTGALPSLAWRVQTAQRAVVLLDTASGGTDALETLLSDADLVIARVQTKDGGRPLLGGGAMGAMMRAAGVRELVLANMPPADETMLADLRKSFSGALTVLNPDSCVVPANAGDGGSAPPE